jgi:biotin synthase
MLQDSPDYVRTSLAAAITLGFRKGWFYRDAKLPCINLLLTYQKGCAGNCGYCGLSMRRPGGYVDKSFIRVEWPTLHIDDIIQRIAERNESIKRVCLSMITNKKSIEDTITITRRIRQSLSIPISLLISPTILQKQHLVEFKQSGADMLGIAVDCATPELFDTIRGSGVHGPHKWKRYWDCYKDAIDVFGLRKIGVHLIVGLGETEKEMIETIQKAYDMGGCTHLFSFFPEKDSGLADHPQPSIDHYRRIQLARFLIDEGICVQDDFGFDESERLININLSNDELMKIIERGTPFMTSGCPGLDGRVACNRPYANCQPGSEIRNYPFDLDPEDIEMVKDQLSKNLF